MGKDACVSHSRKEKATDGGPMSASEKDRKTGRELVLTNLLKEIKGRPLSQLPIMENT